MNQTRPQALDLAMLTPGLVMQVARALQIAAPGEQTALLPEPYAIAVEPRPMILINGPHMPTREVHADLPALALFEIGHARGLRVDLGECPACRTILQFETRADALEWCSQNGRSRKGVAAMPAAWTESTPPERRRRRRGEPRPWWGLWLGERWARCADVGCPACTVDGKPTGRNTVPWEQALLDAMGSPAAACSAERCGCETRSGHPGDPDIIRTLAVLADKLQTAGDPLGWWLAAWLAGPCRACNGAGEQWTDGLYGHWGDDAYRSGNTVWLDACPRCHGHVSMLGECAPALAEALEPLTWIRDPGRPPKVGDEIELARGEFGRIRRH